MRNYLVVVWFSIFRFNPNINDQWKFYSSIELFNLFGRQNHLVSVQRIRLGFDYQQIQFGIAGNFNAVGDEWINQFNIGRFIRKSF